VGVTRVRPLARGVRGLACGRVSRRARSRGREPCGL